MKTFPATCKFCGCSVAVKMDEAAFDMFKVDYWLSLAACNWCADYRSKLLVFIDALHHLVSLHSQCDFMSENAAKGARPQLRERIEVCTKQLCRMVDRHWKVTTPWTNEFVDILIEKPDHVRQIVLDYSRHTEKESKKTTADAPQHQPYPD